MRIEDSQSKISSVIETEFLIGSTEEWEAFLENKLQGPTPRVPGGPRQWPRGMKGSLSHCPLDEGTSIYFTAFSSAPDLRSIGVDVEFVVSPEIRRGIAALVAAGEEFDLLHQLVPGLSAEQAVSILFSAKEAVYKLLYPLLKLPLDFSEARLASPQGTPDALRLSFDINPEKFQQQVEVNCVVTTIFTDQERERELVVSLARL